MARGTIMGLADVVPGVSGGTLALLLGIYDRFIAALSMLHWRLAALALGVLARERRPALVDYARKTDLGFLLALGTGILFGIGVSAFTIGSLIEHVPGLMMALFFGLILVSARLPWNRIQNKGGAAIGLAVTATALAATLATLPARSADPALAFVFAGGVLAITAMLLPGISGSALLVVIGLYPAVLGAVRTPDLLVLVVFALGGIVGLLASSRGIRWALGHHHDATMAVLTGLMIGSVVRVWPWRSEFAFGEGAPAAPDTWWPAVLIVAGAAASWLLEAAAAPRRDAVENT